MYSPGRHPSVQRETAFETLDVRPITALCAKDAISKLMKMDRLRKQRERMWPLRMTRSALALDDRWCKGCHWWWFALIRLDIHQTGKRAGALCQP